MPFNFFKKQSKSPKPEHHNRIQSYCDFVNQNARRRSDASLLRNFSGDTIRLIVFKDQYGDSGDDRNHDQRVIFDSKCVSTEKGSGHQKMSRSQSDHRALLDLVFGNVELAFRGDCLRIHCTTDPLHLYLSTVFTPTRARSRESSLSRQNSTSSLASIVVSADDSLCLGAPSAAIPMHLVAQYALDNQIMSDATPNTSGISTSVGTNWLSSMESVKPAGSGGMSGSRSSGNIHQAVAATLPTGLGHRSSISGRPLSQSDQKPVTQSDSMTSLISACGRSRRPTRLALCILMSPFPTEEKAAADKFLADFFANAALWQFLFFALCREVTELLLNTRHSPVSEVWHLLTRFRESAVQVVVGPRLSCPVWLSLVATPPFRRQLMRRFAFDCLRTAILLLNNKNNAFFLSTLLTSVLTHHSAWVRCARGLSRIEDSSCRCRFGRSCTPTRQVHDLYGTMCCGLTRVVVTGRDRHLVISLLHVLSYFIRSGFIRPLPSQEDEEGPPDDFLTPPSSCSMVSGGDKTESSETASEPVQSSPLTDSGLSSQEDLAPDLSSKSRIKATGQQSESMATKFCEKTDGGTFLHLPLPHRDYPKLSSIQVGETSHSLLGAVLTSYSSTLALQGLCPSSSSSSTNFSWEDDMRRDLRHAAAWSGAPYAVCLIADVDSHSVREVRVDEVMGPEDDLKENCPGPARCVLSMLETAQGLLGSGPASEWAADACLSAIEHSMTQMVVRARVLWHMYQATDRVAPIEMTRMGIEASDLSLYHAVAVADLCSRTNYNLQLSDLHI